MNYKKDQFEFQTILSSHLLEEEEAAAWIFKRFQGFDCCNLSFVDWWIQRLKEGVLERGDAERCASTSRTLPPRHLNSIK
ncbi:hypothetical protein C5167_014722 [Papaver somniferum]|uniref:Uncharacterized protein n=1 Tax=Papaver somniferum TaxID=3469 RepID=A0A4Y7J8C7_PAPSO|nr:hypothetical protein C5167_014722 [Papaver somniferum]